RTSTSARSRSPTSLRRASGTTKATSPQATTPSDGRRHRDADQLVRRPLDRRQARGCARWFALHRVRHPGAVRLRRYGLAGATVTVYLIGTIKRFVALEDERPADMSE